MTHKVFLNFLECGRKEDHSQWYNGGVLVCRRYTRNLLNACSKQKEQIGVFRKLFCPNDALAGATFSTPSQTTHTSKKFRKKHDQVVLARGHEIGAISVIHRLVVEGNYALSSKILLPLPGPFPPSASLLRA
jgi:hypothetical protein